MTNAKGVLEWMEWKEREKKLKENMTNEERFCSLPTEEKAIFLCNELQDDEVGTLANRFERELYSEYPIRPMNAYHEVMRWLKEKHNE